MSPLTDLHPGDDATVAAVHGDIPLRQRLAALGVRPGRSLRPLRLRVGTTDLSRRRRHAHAILVHR